MRYLGFFNDFRSILGQINLEEAFCMENYGALENQNKTISFIFKTFIFMKMSFSFQLRSKGEVGRIVQVSV